MKGNLMGPPVPLSNVEFADGYVGPGLRRNDGCGEEELADIAVLDQRRSNDASGANQVLPPEVCRKLLDGQGRLQAIREWRGHDRAAVAAYLRLDEAALARIETDRRPLDADAAGRVAKLLDVPAYWIAG